MTNVVFATRLWPKLPTPSITLPTGQIIAHALSNLFPSPTVIASFVAHIKKLVGAGTITERSGAILQVSRFLEQSLACEFEASKSELSEAEAISVGRKIVREQDELIKKIVNKKVEAERERIEEKYVEQIKSLQDSLSQLGGQSESRAHLVILVHGIKTRAHWMNEVKSALKDAGFTVAPTSYGLMGLARFLPPPILGLRKKAIDRLVSDIRTAILVYKKDVGSDPKRLSAIAHSFGTFAIGSIMKEHSEFKWHRIIFCGSVVREDFPFEQVLDRFDPPLVNEVGTKDYWPALAESAGWDYGSVGSTGFNRPPVNSRWHHGLKHSDFLTRKFCDGFWVPFLQGESPRQADAAMRMPLLIRILIALRLRWAIVFLSFCVVAGIALLGKVVFDRIQ